MCKRLPVKMGSLFHMSPKCRKPLFVEGKSSQPGASQTDGEIAFACKSSRLSKNLQEVPEGPQPL